MTERHVLIESGILSDLCVLALESADTLERTRLSEADPLVLALRGAVAEVRVHSVMEPAS